MKFTRTFSLFILLAIVCLSAACSSESPKANAASTAPSDLISGKPQDVPIPGMVTMVDIGAHECVPCKMMTPIIEELSTEYAGKAAIVFIDVWENQGEAQKFGIRSIPTQIFYDAEGKEQFRHTGFMSKGAIVAMLEKLGVK